MPIKPPRLDDRAYDDIVREARALIPQYCPEWTHLGDSDPGMTLVQLFAWMTEMTLYRLNRVPDKTYVHFLNFIGEERRTARPAMAPVTFTLRTPERGCVEIPAGTRCSTRQESGGDALHFLTDAPVSVHGAAVERMLAVEAGPEPKVRELPFEPMEEAPGAVRFDQGRGLSVFELDPIDDGPRAYTTDHYVYLRHEDFLQMADEEGEGPGGTLRVRSGGEVGQPIAAMFSWEYPTGAGDDGWEPVGIEDGGEVMGLPETLLQAELPGLQPLEHLGDADDPMALPDGVPAHGWIRGRVDHERWLARLMEDELTITWADDRGGLERGITNWFVRSVGRTLELHLQNLPPIRAGWTLRLTMVDHGLPTGSDGRMFPRYRWSYRRGQRWVPIRPDHVEVVGASIVITGPLTDMAADGFNLRAERAEVVDLSRILPELRATLQWRRPVEVLLAAGPEQDAAAALPPTLLPAEPFQSMPSLPPLLGMKFFFGSDLLSNRTRSKVLLELEVGFEREGELVAEPVDDYHLQLTYRSVHGWQVVHHDEVDLARFTLSDLDEEGAKQPERRRIRMLIDPVAQLDGLVRDAVAGRETSWLRLELTRAALTWQKDKKTPPVPVSLRVFEVSMSLEGRPGATTYDEPMPGTRVMAVEHRPHNRRFSRVRWRHDGRVVSELPFDGLVGTDDDAGGHHAVYLKLDRPLPVGRRFTTMFRCRGETYLPRDVSVQWELLEAAGATGRRWTRLVGTSDTGERAYALDRTGELAFGLDEPMEPAAEGVWIRGVFRHDGKGPFPALPPLTHLMPNTVEARNLHGFRMEKFSGEGVPLQTLQLRHFPIYLQDPGDAGRDRSVDLSVVVEEDDGERHTWTLAPGNSFSHATKDDRVFVVDAVEGTLTFGNGIRGRILPIGSFNVIVESYHTVPGAAGNVAGGAIELAEGYSDLVEVTNLVPAHAGRNAESIDEIIRRAPSVLTSRDRAVTRQDFEVIAREASAEVARAACVGDIGADGGIEVVVLARRRPDEVVPDPFLAAGLKDHVQRYLADRCLVNVRPRVRLATFRQVDVSVDVRLKPHANKVAVREAIAQWIRRFLDPYEGGLDAEGWPFGGTLYAQDFGRLVRDVPEARHVVDVGLYAVEPLRDAPPGVEPGPGWTTMGEGQRVLELGQADLLQVREVRVRWAEGRR